MKLRNLMYATMIACAFASCSKDDVIDNGPDPVAKGDAALTIVVNAEKVGTKAVKPEGVTDITLANETDIKSLTLVVFNSTGAYLGHGTSKDNEVVVEGLVPQSIKFMVFANMDIANISNLTSENIFTQALPLNAEKGFVVAEGLPMASKLVSDITLVSGNNYYGYDEDEMTDAATNGKFSIGQPLPLYRNVARVDLEAVKLDMAKSDYVSGTATFQYTGVSIKDAADKAYTSGAIDATAGHVNPVGETYAFYKNVVSETLAKKTQVFSSISEAVEVNAEKAYYYVLANTQSGEGSTPTELVVTGKFSLTNAKKAGSDNTYTLAERESSYPIVIGVTGMTKSVDIEKNKVYQITLLVAGPGKTDGGDPAKFYVKTKVADWETVDQIAPVK